MALKIYTNDILIWNKCSFIAEKQTFLNVFKGIILDALTSLNMLYR